MKSYFRIQELKAGEIFNGSELTSDDHFVIAENYDNSIVIRKLLSELTPTEEGEVLSIAKEFKIDSLKQENTTNLETAFEYPASSGNTFDISNKKIQDYLGLNGLKDSFVYPYEYFGNGQGSVIFNSSADVSAFFAAALTTFNTIQQSRFAVAADTVKAVTISTTLTDAINQILNVNY